MLNGCLGARKRRDCFGSKFACVGGGQQEEEVYQSIRVHDAPVGDLEGALRLRHGWTVEQLRHPLISLHVKFCGLYRRFTKVNVKFEFNRLSSLYSAWEAA